MSGLNHQFAAMNMNGPSIANMPNMAKNMKDKAPHVVDGGMPFSASSLGGPSNMRFEDDEGMLEGYVLRKAEQRNGELPKWRETTLKSMVHHPDGLYRMMEKQQRELQRKNKDFLELCDELSPNKSRAVHDAVDQRNRTEMDPSYRWYLVYLNSKTRETPGGLFSRPTVETHAIEIILQRLHKNARTKRAGFKSSNDAFPGHFNPTNSMKGGNMASPLGAGININSIKQGKQPQGQTMNFPQQKSANFPGNVNFANMGNVNGMKNMQQGGFGPPQMQHGNPGMLNGGGPKIVPFNSPKSKGGQAGGFPPRSNSPIIIMAEGPAKKNRAMSNGQVNMNAEMGGPDRRQFNGQAYDNHKMRGRANQESSSDSESDSEASYTDDTDGTDPSSHSSRPPSKAYIKSSKGYPNSKAYIKPNRSSSRRQSAIEDVYREHRRRSTIDPRYPVDLRALNGGSTRQSNSMRAAPHRSSSISYAPQYDHKSYGVYGAPVINNFPSPKSIVGGYGYVDPDMMRRQEDALEHQARVQGQAFRR